MKRLAAAAGILVFAALLALIISVAVEPPRPGTAAREARIAPCAQETPRAPAADVESPTPAPEDRVDYGAAKLSNGRSVERMFEITCAACLLSGAAGAPRRGNREEWRLRIDREMAVLYHSAQVGVPPGMPAKGLCCDCTAGDLGKMVDYLVAASR